MLKLHHTIPVRITLALALLFLSIGSAQAGSPSPDPIPSSPAPAFDQTGELSADLAAPSGLPHILYLPILIDQVPPPLGDLISGWYLMVDDEHIQSRQVERIYHPFKKSTSNPVMRADKWWEGKAIQLYGTVYPGFRMWCSSYNFDGGDGLALYAESTDGLTWNKPALDLSGRNTLLGGQPANLMSVLHTPLDKSQPFKLFAYQDQAFNGHFSLNGIATTPYQQNPLLMLASQ